MKCLFAKRKKSLVLSYLVLLSQNCLWLKRNVFQPWWKQSFGQVLSEFLFQVHKVPATVGVIIGQGRHNYVAFYESLGAGKLVIICVRLYFTKHLFKRLDFLF